MTFRQTAKRPTRTAMTIPAPSSTFPMFRPFLVVGSCGQSDEDDSCADDETDDEP